MSDGILDAVLKAGCLTSRFFFFFFLHIKKKTTLVLPDPRPVLQPGWSGMDGWREVALFSLLSEQKQRKIVCFPMG